jgi:hypothetical protein
LIRGLNLLPGINLELLVNQTPVVEFEKATAAALASMKANASEAGEAVGRLVQNWVDLAVAIEMVGTAGRTTRTGTGGRRGGRRPPPVPGGVDVGGGDETEEAAGGFAVLNQEMEISAENVAKINEQLERMAASARLGQIELMAMAAAGEFAGTVAAGIFGGNIGELARWKAEQNAIMAAEHAAMALAAVLIPGLGSTLAGKHGALAAQFAGISAAWGTLAGVTGGFSGGGGARGAAGSPRDTGGAASERAEVPGAEVHIHFVGPGFNALNPEVQRVVYGSIQEATERFGPNANVKIHRRPRP